MKPTISEVSYSEAETVARREAALKKNLLSTPPKPHKASKGKGKESHKK